MAAQEGVEVGKVDLSGPADVDGMYVLVPTGSRLFPSGCGSIRFFDIEIDRDAEVITVKSLSGPGELVAIVDPEVGRLTKSSLDSLGVPDLLDEDTLRDVGIAAPGNIVLMDDGGWRLKDIECVEREGALSTEVVELGRALGKAVGNGILVAISIHYEVPKLVDVFANSRHDEEEREGYK